jgi:DNA-binding transcriptional LysR family regulator
MSWHPVVLSAIERFRATAPAASLRIEIASSRDQIVGLEEARFDLGFLFNRVESGADFLDAAVASRHNVCLAAGSGSTFARRRSVKLAELAKEPFVFFSRETSPIFFDRLITACRGGGLTPEIVQTGTHEAAILGLVAAGVGISIVNDALEHRRPASVRLLRIEDLSVPLVHELAWRKDDRSPLVDQFRRCFIETSAARE